MYYFLLPIFFSNICEISKSSIIGLKNMQIEVQETRTDASLYFQ